MGNRYSRHNPKKDQRQVTRITVLSICGVNNSQASQNTMKKLISPRTALLFLVFLLLVYVFIITGSDEYSYSNVRGRGNDKQRHRPTGNRIPKFIDVQKRQEEQIKRKAFIYKKCQQLHVTDSPYSVEDIQDTIGRNIMVNDKYKLLFCFIPKVGCTTWKRIFLVLNGFINTTLDLKPGEVKAVFSNITTLKQTTAIEALKKLKTYTKITFVRHPFSRVLSAFRSKLRPGLKFDYTKQWRDNLGRYIMKRYRSGTNRSTYDLTFTEFVRYLGDETQKTHYYYDNNHFYSQHKTCLPCHIDYDYIGTMETFKDDAEYILNALVKDRFIELPMVAGTNSSSFSLQQEYYSKVPLHLLKLLYTRYQRDFQIFGYLPN
ncbi:carbohydrate sulfotransferase 10-like [Anneissia japonica]|uniref:carbohydrate sulfotransferase 10-like n=1 Tax=Anneissia japonica TaxID=1529436 RepID=UPI0014257FE0|nr:carbohydrate sulfotransferase 10-like [Anneissia japonica]XP_033098108.1 carbohydrate sulfotransferase 10-like [Anneissia japonica]XP_033098109.1 carbohydrate sulfotransferase 10-like [Anneissia japonica]